MNPVVKVVAGYLRAVWAAEDGYIVRFDEETETFMADARGGTGFIARVGSEISEYGFTANGHVVEANLSKDDILGKFVPE